MTAPSSLFQAQAVAILRKLGFRIRTTGEFAQVLRHYQAGSALGAALVVDGKLGPATSAALNTSLSRNAAGRPDISQYFSVRECLCPCGGRYAACARFWADRRLLLAADQLRAKYYPHGLTPVDVCRCTQHNADVKGAKSSMHLVGFAMDPGSGKVNFKTLAAERLFSGIGYDASDHTVAHVDLRHASGHNLTGGSLAKPTEWVYQR